LGRDVTPYVIVCKNGEKQGWSVTELDLQDGEGAGIKSATIQFDGPFAYGFLKAESGSTGAGNASRPLTPMPAAILPFASGLSIRWWRQHRIEVSPADIEWEFYRSGGKGDRTSTK